MPNTPLKASSGVLEVISDEPEALESFVEPPEVINQWNTCRRFIESACMFQKASLAAQVMAGLELIQLKKHYNISHGGDRKSNPHCVGLIWETALKEHLYISKSTAQRWIEMAQAAKPRLKKINFDLGNIISKNPYDLSSTEQEMLTGAVIKITDGYTQSEFMREMGLVKLPQGSGARGGNTRSIATNTPDDTEETHAETGACVTKEEAANAKADMMFEGQRASVRVLINLLDEQLRDKKFHASDKSDRIKLHGYLIDLAAAVKDTL